MTRTNEGRYVVKCDECKRDIRSCDTVRESAAGGRCDECRAEFEREFGAPGVIRYYGLVADGPKRTISEVLVTVVPGQRSTQELTGVTYRTQREGLAENKRKNLEIENMRYPGLEYVN